MDLSEISHLIVLLLVNSLEDEVLAQDEVDDQVQDEDEVLAQDEVDEHQ